MNRQCWWRRFRRRWHGDGNVEHAPLVGDEVLIGWGAAVGVTTGARAVRMEEGSRDKPLLPPWLPWLVGARALVPDIFSKLPARQFRPGSAPRPPVLPPPTALALLSVRMEDTRRAGVR